MFIDTANLDQVKEMLSFNQFGGVTTNPKLLHQAIGQYQRFALKSPMSVC